MQVQPRNEQPHEREVSRNRDQAVRHVKSSQPAPKTFGRLTGARGPRPSFMPDEVVKYRGFDRKASGRQVVHFQHTLEQAESQQLHADSSQADGIEFQPCPECPAQGRRSSRYNQIVFRMVLRIVITSIPAIAPTAPASQTRYFWQAIVTMGFTKSTKVPKASMIRSSVGPQMLNDN